MKGLLQLLGDKLVATLYTVNRYLKHVDLQDYVQDLEKLRRVATKFNIETSFHS